MAEYIGLLKTASLFVAVLGFLLVCLSAFVGSNLPRKNFNN